MTKTKSTCYWASTGILALALLSGGIAQLTQQRETVEMLNHLGYPTYFGIILGFWKVLGAVAIVVPGAPRVKEWAYAGIFFNMTGAFASHVVNANNAHLIAPVVFVILTVTSWALRPSSRRIEIAENSFELPQGVVQAS